MQRIESLADVARGVQWLAAHDQRWAAVFGQTGPLPLRLMPDGYGALLSKIVSQQVSVASARAIWGRLEEAGYTGAAAILGAHEDDLRALGLSRQKISYAKALAEAQIDYPALRDAPDAQVVSTLTAVKGIGVWTAEIYMMFCLGRPDVLAAGDLALQIGAQHLLGLSERPTEKDLRKMALSWSPWRAVAARGLFAYYHVIKGREGMT